MSVCWSVFRKKTLMNAQGYSLELIDYSGFMKGEVKMFLCIFINDSSKCISAHDLGKSHPFHVTLHWPLSKVMFASSWLLNTFWPMLVFFFTFVLRNFFFQIICQMKKVFFSGDGGLGSLDARTNFIHHLGKWVMYMLYCFKLIF